MQPSGFGFISDDFIAAIRRETAAMARPPIAQSDLLMAIVALRRTNLLPNFAVRPRDGAVVDLNDAANAMQLITNEGFMQLAYTDLGEMCVEGCFHLWRDIPHGKFSFMHPSVLIGKNGCAVCRGKRVAAKRAAKEAKKAAKKAAAKQ